MHKTLFTTSTFMLVGIALAWQVMPAFGVDFESFDFNDANFTELGNTVNTANPGNSWSTDINVLTDSFTDGAGNYKIAKFNDAFAPNYLQIDDITSSTVGSRFITVDMSGWEFFDSVVGEGEEIRFAFLNDDTGTSGSAVAAEVRIDRNTDTEAIELRGLAVGVGSSDISDRATLNTAQANPFTMVLELNKTSNTYEVFYKDGSNPSQSLGMGSVVPIRDGNSIRFVVNNNFGSDLNEFFSIDRVALTDTNPLTDLLTLEVHRRTGVMKLINTSGGALAGLESYSITSGLGALNSANWIPITDNYDNISGPGNGSVDMDDDWAIDASSTIALSESAQGGDGGNLTNGQEVFLSMGSGPWIKNPTEDLQMELMFTGGVIRRANVNFVGNGGERFEVADMNFDGSLTVDDWTIFIAGAETDLSGLSVAQAYQSGDFDADGVNSIFDFGIFKNAYDAANGIGAFEVMIAGVPEPTSLVLFSAGAVLLATRRRNNNLPSTATDKLSRMTAKHFSQGQSMSCTRSLYLSLLVTLVSLVLSNPLQAGIREDFQFNDSNGTLLADAANSVPLGSTWSEDTTDMDNSSVLNGVYRIQKSSAVTPSGFGTNYIDIKNVLDQSDPNDSTSKLWLVAEMAGWHFSSIVGPDEFDSSQLEQIRFDFLDNDTGTSGSTITAEVEIERVASGGIEINGLALGGGTPISAQPLSLTQNDPFTVVLAIDKIVNTYEIFTKDGAGPFTSLGAAAVSSTRNANSVRFVANNSFAGTGEFFDIDRIYVTDVDPVNVVQDLLTLQVDLGSGGMSILNDTSSTFEIDSYRIESTSDDLVFANWSSFSDQNLDPTDGPDPMDFAGDGIGETWDEAAGSDNGVLAESFLLGNSIFSNGRSETLGNVFDVSGDPNSLGFVYRNADTGAVATGNIEFVMSDADFDGSNTVAGNDFLIWQRGFGLAGQTDNSNGDADGSGTVDNADLAVWEGQYGTSPLSAIAAVPEPTAGSLFALALASSILGYRSKG